MKGPSEVLTEAGCRLWRKTGISRLSRRGQWVLVGAGVFGLIVLIAVAAEWDDIMRTGLDPREPFQTYRKHLPPAPNYAMTSAWALIPTTPDRPAPTDPPADVFFIHPTTFDGGRNWNGPINNAWSQRLLEKEMLPNYAGPFVRVGRIFAPRYRQASLYAHMTLREDAREARIFAYGDVQTAFRYYLDHFNQGRPIVLVGVEQGGLLGDRLLREEIARNPDLVRRLTVAYLIDTIVPRTPYQGMLPVSACMSRTQIHCVMGWKAVEASDPNKAKQLLARALVWSTEDQLDNLREAEALCVNPLFGAQSDDTAPAKLNLGAANATELEWGARPPFLPRQVSAQCKGGILRISHPRSATLRPPSNWPDKYKAPSNNLFFADLEADAMKRVATYLGRADFPQMANPIENSVAVRPVIVHRAD